MFTCDAHEVRLSRALGVINREAQRCLTMLTMTDDVNNESYLFFYFSLSRQKHTYEFASQLSNRVSKTSVCGDDSGSGGKRIRIVWQ